MLGACTTNGITLNADKCMLEANTVPPLMELKAKLALWLPGDNETFCVVANVILSAELTGSADSRPYVTPSIFKLASTLSEATACEFLMLAVATKRKSAVSVMLKLNVAKSTGVV